MPDITDLQLHNASIRDPNVSEATTEIVHDDFVERSDRSKWLVLAALLVIAAAVMGYVALRRRTAAVPSATRAPVVSAPAPMVAPTPAGPLVEAEKIALPPLGETDAIVREMVVKLSSHPKALAWLATNGLIENFTVATLNVSEGKTPVAHWPTLKPQARFAVVKTAQGFVLDARSYRRYDDYASAISALDPAGAARLYLTLKPRILEAYRGLGFPDGDFDPVLERAIGVLVATPSVDGEIPLREKVLSYEFIDPNIESLPGAAKQLLRMGPDNMRTVQGKLREIARQLGLHPRE